MTPPFERTLGGETTYFCNGCGYSDNFFPSCIRRRRRECGRCSVEARQRRRHADRAAALTDVLRQREKKRRGRCELTRDDVAALLRGTPAWPDSGGSKLSIDSIDRDKPLTFKNAMLLYASQVRRRAGAQKRGEPDPMPEELRRAASAAIEE